MTEHILPKQISSGARLTYSSFYKVYFRNYIYLNLLNAKETLILPLGPLKQSSEVLSYHIDKPNPCVFVWVLNINCLDYPVRTFTFY